MAFGKKNDQDQAAAGENVAQTPADAAPVAPAVDATAADGQQAPVTAEAVPESASTQGATAQAPAANAEPEGMSEAVRQFLAGVDAANEAVADAKAEYKRNVSDAERDLKKAQNSHDNGIKKGEKELQKLVDSFSAKVDSFSGVTLYEDRITDGTTTIKLTPELTARAEATGSIEQVGDGGDTGKSNAVQDSRSLKLSVASPLGSFEVLCKPDKGKEAAAFVQKITSHAAVATDRENEKNTKVAAARQSLDALRADTAAIQAAQEKLDTAKAATAPITEAEAKASSVVASATSEQRAALQSQTKRRSRNKAIVIAVLVAVIAIAMVIVLFNVGVLHF